jgi:hypothetical protein
MWFYCCEVGLYLIQFWHMNTTEVLGKLHDFISQPILFAVFGLICIVFGISSFILLFHWDRYAIDKSMIVTARAIYFLGGALILLIGLISVILY